MLKNYFKIAWRNLLKNKKSSFINIAGLAMGMAVFILIALWIWDELSYNNYFKNYERIGQIVQTQKWNGEIYSGVAIPKPLGPELKANYNDNFDYIAMASWEGEHILSHHDKNLTQGGIYIDVDGPKMLSLKLLQGSIDGLKDPNSIMLSQSTAKAFFGDKNPINELMKIDQKLDVKVTAVYEDSPYNTTFRNLQFIAPWELYVTSEAWIKRAETQWGNNSFQLFAQIKEGSSFEIVNKNIANAKLNKVSEEDKKFHAQILLHPMKDWHLRNEWKEGKVVGGLIEYVKLFSLIGVFVLLLACINFMNLSTARSERRAKEVGVRKTVGSPKKDLVFQFLSESVLIAFIAFFLSILLVVLALPWFNEVADKKISILWTNGWFWAYGMLFTLLTGIIAGSYPAFYLSSFNPLAVLKGTFKVGKSAAIPRRVLVTIQFTISIALIIGTIIVFRQIQYTKDRPVGYNRERLMMINMKTPDFYGKFEVLRAALKEKGVIEELSESSSPLTGVWSNSGGFDWEGKDPDLSTDFATIWVTHEFGKTVDWRIKEGRDFSRSFATDSAAIVINEAAVKFMGIKNPIGKMVKWSGMNLRVVGIVNDLIMDSPFNPVKQTVYLLNYDNVTWINLKLNPQKSMAECLPIIENTFKEVIPNAPFDYKFADTEYAAKFAQEERIGKLATFFASLAIIISALGVFGLASFTAEQRTKEIGIRKIIGANLFQLWQLLSKDFVLLVGISCLVAIPISYYLLNEWLQKYTYRTDISWWIFASAAIGTIVLTIIIVSFQTIKAARANPVKSLRSE
ncbi:ABC transporter permease [Olivibacter domesticus]|uniref:ABC-type antimicrobial peptide transport system, permease component n=1 Tax=Olivibacter domesticus TaxID=407022 RepID=A0A1H7SK94_OLID1|nr:ABC transporter permease [Olivibacter domesticus]SEL71847.1 ABC-type antimicrobial peptide transport system, permease component [Olivibacter domesticus]